MVINARYYNFIKEFEGIIGAVLGAVATLIVTDILKRKGKLNLFLMSYKGEYYYFNEDGEGFNSITTKKGTDGLLRYYKLKFVIDVYNSSELPKIMRNIKLKVFKGKDLIKELEIYDEDTKRMVVRCIHMDNANIFNINARESYNLNLCAELPKELAEKLKDGLIFKLSYKDEKNKEKTFEIFNGKYLEEEIEKDY